MRRWRRRLAAILAIVLAAVVVALAVTDLPADRMLFPATPGVPTVALFVVSNGFHTGLAIPRPELAEVAGRDGRQALIAVTQRFSAYDFLEFGWGEELFYRGTPAVKDIQWQAAFRALFLDNKTIVQVVGLTQPPQIVFAGATLARVNVSAQGFARLAAKLDATFALAHDGTLNEIGPGLYGPSLFFRARGRTHLFNVCNNWIGRLLNAAGLANAPGLTMTANGLFADLQFRSGVRVLRQNGSDATASPESAAAPREATPR